MKTKEMIEFLEKNVMDWDGWEFEEMNKFVAIIESLQEHEMLKKLCDRLIESFDECFPDLIKLLGK